MAKEIRKTVAVSRRVKQIGNNKKNSFNFRKEGKDVKRIKDKTSLAPIISVNTTKPFTRTGKRITRFDPITIGLGQNIISRRISSFKDFPDLDPVHLVANGAPYEAFPYTYSTQQNNERYRILDELSMDGVIEVIIVRKNRNISDIETTGIKVGIGAGNIIGMSSTTVAKKGTSTIENKIPFAKINNDFFEDSQDVLFSDVTFPEKGKLSSSGRVFSDASFSGGIMPVLSPFKDEGRFKDNYTQIEGDAREELLSESRRSASEIGTRFKSARSGFIIDQFQKKIENHAIGTDTIAFVGLLKG